MKDSIDSLASNFDAIQITETCPTGADTVTKNGLTSRPAVPVEVEPFRMNV